MHCSRSDHIAGRYIYLHWCIDFSVLCTQMHPKVIISIFFSDRLNTLIFKAYTITNIHRQNFLDDSDNIILFHLNSTDGSIHIHCSSLADADH